MKKRRTILILSIVAFAITLSLLGYGVYAALSVSSTVSNTFYYNVPENNFEVAITGSITGCKNESQFADFLQHDRKAFNQGVYSYPDKYTIEFQEMGTSDELPPDIVFTFVIENYNSYAIKASIVSNNQETNHFEFISGGEVEIAAYSQTGVGGTWIAGVNTITARLKLTSKQEFSMESNNFTIVFEKVE